MRSSHRTAIVGEGRPCRPRTGELRVRGRCTVVVGAGLQTRPLLAVLFVLAGCVVLAAQAQTQAVTGMVVDVNLAERQLLVSHDPIPGVMPAMLMPFEVRSDTVLRGLTPGTIVSFTLRMNAAAAYADNLKVVRYQSVEQDPLTVQRLRLLRSQRDSARIAVNQPVPAFTLTNQARARIALSQLRGKVVVMNFIYTSCALPQFCYRMTNHFNVLQTRFEGTRGRDLVLLSVTFDPTRDTPDVLADYARQWKADTTRWHFLTGSADEIERIAAPLGLDYFPDEGLITHSLRTVLIDRAGRLRANVEGNRFTAQQLGDLVQSILNE
jgi:protein SCO1